MHATGVIRRSRDRCARQHGLDRSRGLPDRLTRTELSEQREQLQDTLGDALRVVERLQPVVDESRCDLLVGSAAGTVVRRVGRRELGRTIDEGSVWSEGLAGTNAIGTTLSEGVPITVQGDQHLLEVLHPFVCTAVPLLDADQRVVGALDLTTWAATHPNVPFLRHVLERVAAEAHCRAFARRHERDIVLALSDDPSATDPALALVAVREDGTIAGWSRAASELVSRLERCRATTALGALLQERLGDLRPILDAPLGTVRRIASLFVRPLAVPRPRPARPAPRTSGLRGLAGGDPVVRRHVDVIERIVDRAIPIVLRGETGTGKDTLARAIHASSARADGPFVAVNCASLPESLLDSELFGYAPGTFTGGLKDGKRGKILASHGGTLFLDEIGDMPLALQGRLLRVLAEREVTPLGAVEPVPVDLSVISATHRDLRALVAEGQFREDLYYRLAGASFELPPLRARADLDQLIERILREEADAPSIEPEAVARLLAHPWPGNVRELRQVLRFAAACAGERSIGVDDLPEEVRGVDVEPAGELRAASEAAEGGALLQALGDSGWNVSAAAARLGIGRATAHRKIRAYGITRPGRGD